MNLVDQLKTMKAGIDALMEDATKFDVGEKEGMDLSAPLRKSIQELRSPFVDMRNYISDQKKEYNEMQRYGSAEKKVEALQAQIAKAQEKLVKAQEDAAKEV